MALEGVAKLRAQIQRQGGVDFLTRLELDEGNPKQADTKTEKKLAGGFQGASSTAGSEEGDIGNGNSV